MTFNLFRSCREVTALVLAREDRHLALRERAVIRLHFLVCKACPVFEEQVLTMRQALDGWRHYREAEPGED